MSSDHHVLQLSPLRIAIVGAGAIGSTFAFHLARTGKHQVTAIARPESVRLQQLQRDGGIVTIKGEHAEMHVADALDESTPFDLVIVTLLAHQVDAVVPQLQRSAAKGIQFMFNNFDPERLEQLVGSERCSFGMPFVQATLQEDGRLEAKVGTGGQKCKMNDARWVAVFNGAGLPSVFEPKMQLWLRCHAPLCVAFESVSHTGVQRGSGVTWAEATTVARGAKECFRLIEQLGYPIYPTGKALFHNSPPFLMGSIFWVLSRVKSFRDLLATGVGECRALVDSMVAEAKEAEVAVSLTKIQAMKP